MPRNKQLPLRALMYLIGLALTVFVLFTFDLPVSQRDLEGREIGMVRLNYKDQTYEKGKLGTLVWDPRKEDLDVLPSMNTQHSHLQVKSEDEWMVGLDRTTETPSGQPQGTTSYLKGSTNRSRHEQTTEKDDRFLPRLPSSSIDLEGLSLRDAKIAAAEVHKARRMLSVVVYISRTAHTRVDEADNLLLLTALQSYAQMTSQRDIFVFVDAPSDCTSMVDIAKHSNCLPVPCFHAQYGKPIMSCLLMMSQKVMRTEYIVFLTGPHILTKHFHVAFQTLGRVFSDFAMVGTTWDVDASLAGRSWDTLLRDWDNDRPLYGTSYAQESNDVGFILLRRSVLPPNDFPPFLITGNSWPAWLLSFLFSRKHVRVIDVSDAALVLRDKNRIKTPFLDLVSDLKVSMIENKAKMATGNLANVDYYLAGKCPVPSCVLYPNKNSELVTAVHRHANAAGHVSLIPFNHKFVPIAKNWVCHARSIGIGNFILLAEDLISYEEMKDFGAAVVLMPDAPMRERVRASSSPYSYKVSSKLFRVALSVLEMGFSVLVSDIDTIWFENILHYFGKKCSVTMLNRDETLFSDALIAIQADNSGLNFWKEVVKCISKDSAYAPLLRLQNTQKWKSSWKDTCLSVLIEKAKKEDPAFLVCHFSDPQFSTIPTFFHEKGYQLQGIWPTFVHTRFGKDADLLEQSMRTWQLWKLSSQGKCGTNWQQSQISPPPLNAKKITLLISVVASANPDSLARLLGQLQGASYIHPNREVAINLELLIEKPKAPAEPHATDLLQKCLEVANGYGWEWGSYHIHMHEAGQSAIEKLLGVWLPQSESEFRLVLDESAEISPLFASVIFELLERYYFDSANFNPQIFGLCIQRQHSSVSQHSISQDISKLVGRKPVFGYQLYGGYGTLFFPSHWEKFQDWAIEGKFLWKKLCLPKLVSNRWIKERRGGYAALMALLTRFLFDEGWYFLFLNLQDGSTLVTSWNEKEYRANLGLKVHSLRGNDAFFATNDSLENFIPPDLSEVPTYDLHLRQVMEPAQLLQRKSFLANLNVDQLCTIL